MSGDIVERLRRWDDGRISTHWAGCMDTHPECAIVFAADAIEARDAKIERLQAAGDALATNYELMLEQDWSSFLEAVLHEWKEARRA